MVQQDAIRPIPQLLQDNARRRGGRLAFADDHRRVTWGALEERTARLAAGLGAGRGDRVAFCLGTGVDLVEAVLAAVRAAAIGVPLSPHCTDAELTALLADCAPSVLVTDERRLSQVLRVTAGGPPVRLLVAGTGPLPAGALRLSDLTATAGAPPRDDLGLDEPAFMLYTSGTTGSVKGAVSTQRAALWSAFTCYGPVLGLTSDDHLLWPLPMAHSFAHSLCVLGVTVAGASARIVGEPSPARVARLLAEESPSVVAGVPATYRQLLDAGPVAGPALRICLTAGAVSDPALRAGVEALLGVPLLDCYGSTETCGMMAVEPAAGPRVAGTSGPPAPGVEVRLVDTATGEPAATEGEIWVRGPNLMLGYHGRPEATAEVLTGGWYRTGDLGRLDGTGHLSVVGRVSDVIIRGGTNIDPAEVEQALRALPGVGDAAVVARAHPLLGEVPVAFVVPVDESTDPAALLRALARDLSAHKVPEEIVLSPVIPRTPSGKPRRHLLREALAAGPAPGVTDRFAGLTAGERRAALADLVRAEVAALCGPVGDLGTAFADLGLTSMGVMTVWHRLSLRTGLRLPATILWDHPSPAALATYLDARLAGDAPGAPSRLPRAAAEPIAIVAVGCRYPGGVRTPEELWRLVADGVDATSEFPADRGWDVDDIYDTDPDRIGKTSTRRGGFLHDAADFDPAFFGISPREALSADPQHRLLLEVAWETFERAGIPAPSLRDSDTGVFVGLMHGDYSRRLHTHEFEAHLGIGSAGSLASGRIAYVLGLRGPTMTIDTACSSSLVAMDLAAKALRAGECSLALAGGVTVMATPQSFIVFSRQRGLAADGRCRSFAAGADGTAWGEGAGLVLLERLDDARRHGHPVLAILRGSAVNSDGASNGLTAPNGEAQRDLIRLALADAGLRPSDVDVVEGHGTGTRIGDPIEANAVLATYGQERDRPVWLGSVKSNLGHTQAAAGIAGVIKMIEAMRHGEMPRSLYAEEPSPHVDWAGGAVRLLDTAQPWPGGERPRRAAVSAFGLGGTNAHLILEEPDVVEVPAAPAEPAPDVVEVPAAPAEPALDVPEAPGALAEPAPDVSDGLAAALLAGWAGAPWLLGGADEAGLRAQAAQLADGLPGSSPLDVAYSLATGRAALGHRAAVRAGQRDGLLALARGVPHAAVSRAPTRREPRLAFLFTGQGAQRLGMGRELAAAFPRFAETYDAVCAAFTPYLERPLREVIDGADAGLLNRTDYAQPALFAFEVALHALYEACGIRPDHLAGHSIGELTAAHVAGVFSRPDAVRLVAARGRLMAALPAGGAMIAVRATEAEAEKLLAEAGDQVSIAAVNGPESIVFSGAEGAVTALAERLGGRSDRLRVSHAFHSPLLEPMLAGFRAVAESVTYHRPSIPVSCALAGPADLATADYWVRHAREAVRFADAVAGLDAAGATAFVEIGPAAVLAVLAESCVAAGSTAVFVPGTAGLAGFLDALATLHVHGAPVDWPLAYAGSGARRRDLPTYPFQRQRYWLDATPRDVEAGAHPLLGDPQPAADGPQIRHSGLLSAIRQPWLADHIIGDDVMVPAAALAELAFHAASDPALHAGSDLAGRPAATSDPVPGGQAAGASGRTAVRLAELSLRSPLTIAGPTEVQVVVDAPDGTGDRPLTIWSRPAGSADRWISHATATVTAPTGRAPAAPAAWPPPGVRPVAVDYARLADAGFHYGTAFRAVTAVWRGPDDVYAEVSLPPAEALAAGRYGVHPALLDAALHASLLAEPPDRLRVPFTLGGVELHTTGATTVRVVLSPIGPDEARVTVTDRFGRPVVTIDSLVTRKIDIQDAAGSAARRSLHRLGWIPAPATLGETPYEIFRAAAPDAGTPGGDAPARARAMLGSTLARLTDWLVADRPGRLVVVTERATGADPDPAAAAVWGLAGSAQAEHPGRFTVVDLCGAPASEAALPRAAALAEPRVAVREGTVLAPRLALAGPADASPPAFDPAGTVLITGGTGALGAILARHLVAEYGVRTLVLASRTGTVPTWVSELDAEITVTARDVGDRAAVDALVASCGPALTAVFHLAGVLDDGVLAAMTPERIATVLAPKADAAWHLHEATEGLNLAAFVLYSSASGVLGRPGQANYAAANAFMDAVAAHRAARGLPAQSLAWGLWEADDGGMSSQPAAGPARRGLTGDGIRALAAGHGTELLDRALRTAEPLLVPIAIDVPAATAPPILSGLAPARPEPATEAAPAPGAAAPGAAAELSGWRETLAKLPADDRIGVLSTLIHIEIAAVLGFADAAALDPGRHFTELGFDSLAAVQLRNRLSAFTGVRLKATIALEHPTLADLTAHVYAALAETLPAAEDGPAAGIDAPRHSEQPAAVGERFTAIYHRVIREQGAPAAMALRYLASYGLPTFGAEDRARHALAPVRLAAGERDRPILMFIPGYLALHDPTPAGLGRALDGGYDLHMLAHPGFGDRRDIPDGVPTLVRLHADTVRALAGDRPFVLIGDSAGGEVAHAVATHLTAEGTPPRGVILIDSHHGAEGRDDQRALALVTVDRNRPAELFDGFFSDAVMIAGGAYVRIFEGWVPEPTGLPTLLLRAAPTREMLEIDPDRDWRPHWPLPHDVVDVPGDHYTTLNADVATTAAAIQSWLRDQDTRTGESG
ncbi:DNA-binding protein [Actinoplanes sp. ATCC 53533]|uniref:type I polyketide synthase n=1 Tax=Actinoplanes sp. ATCC 53533 TaxID=1288362 RepID=UPI000F792CEA|nr:type I polyketide synthase [Actinoplanes sp. ATCC 53533]RSM69615.1 DNA-binding protein [Actinoplanes sp. ATCC 53533]